ncbi:ribonuclease P protein component [Nocardioides coralli]|uniref:ribonuclease P protein component n=1 Tax=Nocardioides coralli TaxID=2872154 RepID=UPI001CA3B100|nr:ribonuclease P protein component [Nocardioides coralli]QZY29158.1 ribonuclease P protein component [Nocardioides coralli]
MLPAAHRLTDARAFRAVIRGGSRAGSRTLVVHLDPVPTDASGVARVGLVVSRAVGNAVTRNRVQRRLRHLARERLDGLPGSCALVIRALPPASAASSAELASDLDRCLQRVLREVTS